MFGKRKNEELKVIIEQAQEDRKFFAEQAQEDRKYIGEQFALIKREQKEKDEEFKSISDDEKKKAAYALNLCTVSVSQIIDYNDIYILEQEYEAILNNLNLEKIIKDEPLLKTLKLLLDTITFFRIQEKEKDFVEKEYKDKIKNAIWASIPNPSVILATGNPYAMVAALATQVGIGYMNYRKNKNQAETDKEKQMWELQKSAIEQFNGIRRELFDASWRLATKYNFPEEYRLTEKQIRQYDQILMDNNYIRRYDRLTSISANFEAYPYFWYYLGNTANVIANDFSYDITDENREKYKSLAIDHFKKFDELNYISVLREDQIASSCYLEYSELLMASDLNDKAKISELLEKARLKSGGNCDVLQICAMSYMKIGLVEKAKPILKQLIVENYNQKTNAQLLSCILVAEAICNKENAAFEYNSLKLLVAPNETDYMLQLPPKNKLLKDKMSENDKFASISELYIHSQKELLIENWKEAIFKYSKMYENIFDECIPQENSRDIVSASKEINFPDNLLNVFEKMVAGLDELIDSEDTVNILLNKIYAVQTEEFNLNDRTVLEKITEQIYGEECSVPRIKEYLKEINYADITNEFFESIYLKVEEKIEKISNFNSLAQLETALFEFCRDNNIVLSYSSKITSTDAHRFNSLIQNIYNKEELEHIKSLKSLINDYSSELILNNDFKLIVLGNDPNYDSKIKSYGIYKLYYREFDFDFKGEQIPSLGIFAVLDNNIPSVEINDKTPDGLIFTKYGIGKIKNKVDKNKTKVKKEASKFVIPYNKVEFKNGYLYIGSKKYLAENYIDTSKLYGLIQGLKEKIIY